MRCRICGGELRVIVAMKIPREEWVYCSRHTKNPLFYLKCLKNPQHGIWFCMTCNYTLWLALTEGTRLYGRRAKLQGELDKINEAIRYLEGEWNIRGV